MNLRNKNKLLLPFFLFFLSAVKFVAFACLLSSSSRPNDVPGIYTKNLEKFLLVFFCCGRFTRSA